MKILYIHQYYCSLDSAGGTRSYEFARRLIAAGHQVRLITSAAYLDGWRAGGRITRTELDGVPLTVLDVPYANAMGTRARLRSFFTFAALACREALRERPDVIFASSTPLTVAIPALLAKLWHRAPLVFEVRDLWPDLPIACGALRNPLARFAARALEWAAYHGAARVVALSPGIAAGIMRRGVPPDRVVVLPNGCDRALFAGARDGDTLRTRFGLPPGASGPLILYAGTFGAMNNVGYLVEIAAALRQVDPAIAVVLVGKGAEEARIRALAAARGVLGVNLWLLPAVPKRDVPALLAAATVATSVFLPLPQMQDNSANKFFDALAAGKPLAINYEGWQADMLRDSGAGVVLPAADPVVAARILAQFARDSERLAAAAAAARELAVVFDREMLAARLEQVLCEVLPANRRSAVGPKSALGPVTSREDCARRLPHLH